MNIRRAFRRLRGGNGSGKAFPVAWPMWTNGQPVWKLTDVQAYIREGFNLNSLIYAAIMFKTRALSSAPLRAWRGEPENPQRLPPGQPLARLLHRPNPYQSGIEFAQQQVVYLNVTGNSYTYLQRDGRKGLPPLLWNLRPDRVAIVPGEDGTVRGYQYRQMAGGPVLPILPEDMMHVKLPNPDDPLEGMGYGMSPIAPMAQSGDVDNSVTSFLKSFFQSGTMLGGVLKFNIPMDDQMVGRARQRWQEIYGGVNNWGSVAVLDQGGSFERMLPTFKDMAFEALDARNEARTLMVLGVPGMLIGARSSMDNSTYANFEQADRVFWQSTFIPELRLFEAEYEYQLSEGDSFPRYDLSGVPALQKNIPALVEAAHKLWSMGTPRNVAYAAVGLNVPESEGGDVGYIPANVVPVGTQPAAGAQGEAARQALPAGKPQQGAGAKRLTGKGARWTDEQKAAIWKAVDDIAVAWEDDFRDAAKAQFEADKREILTLVSEAKARAKARKATINWLDAVDDVKAYLDGKGADAWKDTFVPLISGVVEDAGDYWSAQTGLAFNVRNLLAEAWFADDYVLKFATPINQTTSDTIQAVLAQGYKEGWSIQDMQTNLETLFRQWMDGDLTAEDFAWFSQRLPPHRTELIARTETTRAQAAGSFNLFKSWEVAEKEWLATPDSRTRDSHAKANGQVKPVDEPFEVGGHRMMHPGDMSLGAPVSEIADCRCALLPVVVVDEDEDED